MQLLFESAQQLGYTRESQLNFFRFHGSFESNADITTLVFSTTDSLNTFAGRVDQLGLAHDTSLGTVYGEEFVEDTFVNFINKAYSRSLVLADSAVEYSTMPVSRDIAPLVTRWHLLLSRQPNREVRLVIHFAQLPKKDLFWKDTSHQKNIAGPIIVMEMSR